MEELFDKFENDIKSVESYVDEIYEKFSFNILKEFLDHYVNGFARMNNPITDADLESILFDLPLLLIQTSESLQRLSLRVELLKLDKKSKNPNYSEYEMSFLISVYSNVAEQVKSQMSYSRELIMSSKKIWDRRKESENINPISEMSSEDLPGYKSGDEI